MTRGIDQIGFSQRVRLEWLEQTANLVLAGNDKASVKDALQELLKDKVSVGGQAERGNREKIITILLKTWFSVPRELEPLRVEGLELLKGVPRRDHLAVHWGMVMAAYPFWAAVAETVGRLLRLQGTASAAEVQRRVRELRGERETVARAARRVLRALNDWGVLIDSSRRGTYVVGQPLTVEQSRLALFLLESLVRSSPVGSAPLEGLSNSPALFPFTITTTFGEGLSRHQRLEVIQQASGDQRVSLR